MSQYKLIYFDKKKDGNTTELEKLFAEGSYLESYMIGQFMVLSNKDEVFVVVTTDDVSVYNYLIQSQTLNPYLVSSLDNQEMRHYSDVFEKMYSYSLRTYKEMHTSVALYLYLLFSIDKDDESVTISGTLGDNDILVGLGQVKEDMMKVIKEKFPDMSIVTSEQSRSHNIWEFMNDTTYLLDIIVCTLEYTSKVDVAIAFIELYNNVGDKND